MVVLAERRRKNICIGTILREERRKEDVWRSIVTRGDNVEPWRVRCLLKKSKVCENSLIRRREAAMARDRRGERER